MGDMTRDRMLKFFEPGKAFTKKWLWKSLMKKFMSYYTVCAETNDMQSTKERIEKFVNSPESVDRMMKVFDYKDSKYKTMAHSDLWTSQIMFSLNEDGKSDLRWNCKRIFNLLFKSHCRYSKES